VISCAPVSRKYSCVDSNLLSQPEAGCTDGINSLTLVGLFSAQAVAFEFFSCQSMATAYARHGADRFMAAGGGRRFTSIALDG
jgi:hypothetical protein